MTYLFGPPITSLNRPFWRAAARGVLRLPFCLTTSRSFWPPSPSSPFVAFGSVGWRDVRPRGVAEAKIIFRRPFEPVFGERVPYGIVQTRLECGVRILVHAPDPYAVCPGDRFEIRLVRIVERGSPIPVVAEETRHE